jgi:SAM-dependent methyltransferase
MGTKSLIRRLVPASAWRRGSEAKRRAIEAFRARRSLRRKFTDIYHSDVWREPGKDRLRFYSGRGSDDEFTSQYVKLVSEFIRQHGVKRVLDIGCGDFRVGNQLVTLHPDISYIGADIVKPLIRHNSEVFSGLRNVKFLCLDASKDQFPDADLVLIRQVLQHLSNKNIAAILAKTRKYRWVLASDAVPPNASPSPNEDMTDGYIARESGLYLEQPPFNELCTCLLTTSVYKPGGTEIFENIRTMFIENT